MHDKNDLAIFPLGKWKRGLVEVIFVPGPYLLRQAAPLEASRT